ncbi:mitochondrial ribosomal protein L17 [Jimgerdemannia flammicorona]|uniref:Large ribosomal subunit protein bL17c n=1 Tax=Jimgerdemannia flammicorona TaxID=994334 RepID=A0A433QRD0_9FUNG|nr:mitochondrial ribosomal protein L17 [Jimgerdemannia flammicorona]
MQAAITCNKSGTKHQQSILSILPSSSSSSSSSTSTPKKEGTMHHGKHLRRFNRTSAHRKAMFRNLTSSLIQHESITTTLPKAKDLRRMADRMITLGKQGDEHARRQALAYLRDPKITIPKLFGPLAARFASRSGGYTRIMPLGPRKGDCAQMAVIEYVDGPHDLRFESVVRRLVRERTEARKESEAKKENETKKESGANEVRGKGGVINEKVKARWAKEEEKVMRARGLDKEGLNAEVTKEIDRLAAEVEKLKLEKAKAEKSKGKA